MSQRIAYSGDSRSKAWKLRSQTSISRDIESAKLVGPRLALNFPAKSVIWAIFQGYTIWKAIFKTLRVHRLPKIIVDWSNTIRRLKGLSSELSVIGVGI